ncbi:hypothetical protein M747DRAFT_332541 [Aspergillus niger ATCC 13496]|uniref:Contig An09c0080, genomic contig n=3 Tax=Aspergillus niger TaxID=5061 RepID=A2QTR4_ASPNC|nr:uncharacterized protein An09g03000 [Aspergillus niger]RDH18854.1 hypothetical protein M747DRAFT_332541 [Aspergillus niger ATCC 13496]CAK40239.1 unnamed protein product [Aspergillus niger]|eukprot:XP_001393616.1 hypothetical protein ANI_1_1272084 [Aspergillus niger CBS 513.88]
MARTSSRRQTRNRPETPPRTPAVSKRPPITWNYMEDCMLLRGMILALNEGTLSKQVFEKLVERRGDDRYSADTARKRYRDLTIMCTAVERDRRDLFPEVIMVKPKSERHADDAYMNVQEPEDDYFLSPDQTPCSNASSSPSAESSATLTPSPRRSQRRSTPEDPGTPTRQYRRRESERRQSGAPYQRGVSSRTNPQPPARTPAPPRRSQGTSASRGSRQSQSRYRTPATSQNARSESQQWNFQARISHD